MNQTQSSERNFLYPASPPGQGIVAAAKPYFAKQSMERARRETAESPVFCVAKNAPIKKGKQIAVQDDKVMGFDVHIMVVPSGNGTTTVPLPHPFIGKLADKLSKDVKIKDKACATKDSVAKHDDSMHMQQWAIGSWCNTKKQF